jgi:hypothetical protein
MIPLAMVAAYAILNFCGMWTLKKIDPAVIEESESERRAVP